MRQGNQSVYQISYRGVIQRLMPFLICFSSVQALPPTDINFVPLKQVTFVFRQTAICECMSLFFCVLSLVVVQCVHSLTSYILVLTLYGIECFANINRYVQPDLFYVCCIFMQNKEFKADELMQFYKVSTYFTIVQTSTDQFCLFLWALTVTNYNCVRAVRFEAQQILTHY